MPITVVPIRHKESHPSLPTKVKIPEVIKDPLHRVAVSELPTFTTSELFNNKFYCEPESTAVLPFPSPPAAPIYSISPNICKPFAQDLSLSDLVASASSSCSHSLDLVLADLHNHPAVNTLRVWLLERWSECECTPIKFSLKKHISGWRIMGAHPFILSVIEHGYYPPFYSSPSPLFRLNNKSALEHQDFVVQAVSDLLHNGWARLVSDRPVCVNPLQVAIQSNGKKRLILDLTHVNTFLRKQKFKMDTLANAVGFFPDKGWGFSYDVWKCYYHMDLDPRCQQFFGFSFAVDSFTFYAVFTVVPFGLSSAPWLATKLFKVPIKKWRAQGFIHFQYLDDGLGLHATFDKAKKAAKIVRTDLHSLGWCEQASKCQWEPSQTMKWLGFNIDLCNFLLSIPEEKIQKLKTALEKEDRTSTSSPRRLLAVAGLINCLSIVLGPLALVWSKPFYVASEIALEEGCHYDTSICPGPTVKAAVTFWKTNLPKLSMRRVLKATVPTALCFSDASASGGAAFVRRLSACQAQNLKFPPLLSLSALRDQGRTAAQPTLEDHVATFRTVDHQPFLWPAAEHMCLINWSDLQKQKSSTWRELAALVFGLKALVKPLAGLTVTWVTDNQAVESIMYKGSMKPYLQSLVTEAFVLLRQKQISLTVLWAPRSMNELADACSRIIDYDDWGIHPSLFDLLHSCWGPFSVDRFASAQNALLPRFNSKFAEPGSEFVDALSVDWGTENNWIVPPPTLIPQTIQHIKACKAKGTLVVPKWPSAPFWPLLFPEGQPAEIIQDSLTFPNGARYIVPGTVAKSLFHPNSFHSSLMALRLDASSP